MPIKPQRNFRQRGVSPVAMLRVQNLRHFLSASPATFEGTFVFFESVNAKVRDRRCGYGPTVEAEWLARAGIPSPSARLR